jgi:hypothetical protein
MKYAMEKSSLPSLRWEGVRNSFSVISNCLARPLGGCSERVVGDSERGRSDSSVRRFRSLEFCCGPSKSVSVIKSLISDPLARAMPTSVVGSRNES